MKKYMVKFSVRDFNARGLKFKNSKKTVRASCEDEAIKKVEQTLSTTIYNPIAVEVA